MVSLAVFFGLFFLLFFCLLVCEGFIGLCEIRGFPRAIFAQKKKRAGPDTSCVVWKLRGEIPVKNQSIVQDFFRSGSPVRKFPGKSQTLSQSATIREREPLASRLPSTSIFRVSF